MQYAIVTTKAATTAPESGNTEARGQSEQLPSESTIGRDDGRAWAGDPYEEEPTNPEDSYAQFESSEGEEAWLDRAEDGTLTGWVRDQRGEVWRYADADAWAIHVDDAGMTALTAVNPRLQAMTIHLKNLATRRTKIPAMIRPTYLRWPASSRRGCYPVR